jgi:nondiscriminating glutamyl-tRNA synthetase
MNSEYLKNLPFDEIVNYAKPFIYLDINMDDEKFNSAINFARNRVSHLTEFENEIKYFYTHNLSQHPDGSLLSETASQSLFKFWVNELSKSETWTPETLKILISKTNDELSIKGKDLFFPMRLAIYGECKGPDIPSIYNILGRDEIINRLNSVIIG